jgi:hypothetical protein
MQAISGRATPTTHRRGQTPEQNSPSPLNVGLDSQTLRLRLLKGERPAPRQGDLFECRRPPMSDLATSVASSSPLNASRHTKEAAPIVRS